MLYGIIGGFALLDCTAIVILLPWLSHWSGNFCFCEILAFNAFILEKWSRCQWQCLIQCISYIVVNCIYKNCTMLLSPSFNSIYKIVQCCKKGSNSTPYIIKMTGRMSACVLRPVVLQLSFSLSRPPSVCRSVCLSISPLILSLSLSLSLSLALVF